MKLDRIKTTALIEAGLRAMDLSGRALSKVSRTGRAMIFAMPSGETVRMRTCNDHVLIIVADRPTSDANLNIEGTDWLLVVMPEIERSPGSIVTYLLPTNEVVAEARRSHQAWLDSGPNTRGDNKTWNLWFRRNAPSKANDYATKWAHYRLACDIDLKQPTSGGNGNMKAEVEMARKRIAEVAGVPVEAVKITINFEG